MKMEVAKGVRVRLARRAVGGRPAGVAGPVRPLSQLKYKCYESIGVYDYSSHELLMNITRLGKAKAPCERELLEAPSRGGN